MPLANQAMKTEQQLTSLKKWIEAIVDVKIEQAFNRDSSIEELRCKKIETQLIAYIQENLNDRE